MSRTKLVMLGTGTPALEPGTAQTSMAIVVDDRPYFVDCGSGMIQRARQAGFQADQFHKLFITHLHPDHTMGLVDFLVGPWVLGRNGLVTVFGPKGAKDMAEGLLDLYHIGIEQHRVGGPHPRERIELAVRPIEAGIIFEDELVTVEAFAVNHAGLETYGLVFQTPDKRIVLSADTCYLPIVAEKARNCDILVHECFSEQGIKNRPWLSLDYFNQVHTSTFDVGRIAAVAQPKLVVLNHQMGFDVTPEDFIAEVRQGGYTGEVVYGRDLDVFE